MSQVLIVIDQFSDWKPYLPSEQVLTVEQYLSYEGSLSQRVRVINLCRDYSYLSEGYYCSLLAEARGHHVIPPVRVLNDFSNPLLYKLQLGEMYDTLSKAFKGTDTPSKLTIKSYFGQVEEPSLRPLARLLFERLPCPILEITLHCEDQCEISNLRLADHKLLNDPEQTAFAEALDAFSQKVWRTQKVPKAARYDLAMLVNPDEAMPPSNAAALKKFVSAGKELDIDVELITNSDFMRLPEFDALFIRETTAINHHTYRFAKKAETDGIVVMDDPTSILRCTNKIYLSKLFETHKVPAPRTHILHRHQPEQLQRAAEELGFPMVIKIPDSSFSRGIVKIESFDDLVQKATPLFQQSSLLLAQEFLYTDFDWRIGVLNNKPLYACRYYMVKNHWQIYQHGEDHTVKSGRYDTLPTFEVPKSIMQAALKATKPVGDGFYGVDVKESKGKGFVIEVNDNPNIDSGVEDKYLGNELYLMIMQEFVRRIEGKRTGG